MSAHLWLPDGFKIKSFNGKTAGKKSTVTITVETSDFWHFGYFLKEVANAQQELQRPDTYDEEPASAKSSRNEETRQLSAPPLKLPAPGRD